MAALALLPASLDQNDYTLAEQELQDHVLDVYGTRDNEVDMFRYVSRAYCLFTYVSVILLFIEIRSLTPPCSTCCFDSIMIMILQFSLY
jgi:hypothetical protein